MDAETMIEQIESEVERIGCGGSDGVAVQAVESQPDLVEFNDGHVSQQFSGAVLLEVLKTLSTDLANQHEDEFPGGETAARKAYEEFWTACGKAEVGAIWERAWRYLRCSKQPSSVVQPVAICEDQDGPVALAWRPYERSHANPWGGYCGLIPLRTLTSRERARLERDTRLRLSSGSFRWPLEDERRPPAVETWTEYDHAGTRFFVVRDRWARVVFVRVDGRTVGGSLYDFDATGRGHDFYSGAEVVR
jgi:hypothetical protein